MAKIAAVCISKKKGTPKKIIAEGIFIQNFGLLDDAHASNNTHRQVSLLATESIDKMRKRGFNASSGDFAENLTTEGIELFSLSVGTRMTVGTEVILEISQIGKVCHSKCAIYHQIGECIMPQEGVFARVIRGGAIRAGDNLTLG
jgi:MOSC domain-containing protein YiiM